MLVTDGSGTIWGPAVVAELAASAQADDTSKRATSPTAPGHSAMCLLIISLPFATLPR